MIQKITIPAQRGLDKITAYFDATCQNSGRVTLVCLDMAYSARWAHIGEKTLPEFFTSCEVDYLAGKLMCVHHHDITASTIFLRQIIAAVQNHIKEGGKYD